jgi:hypothetical protein
MSNQTAGTQDKYHRLAERWCRSRGIPADAGDNWDEAVYHEAERQFLGEYREQKRLIPVRIADDGPAPRSQAVDAKVAMVMPVVNLWWRYTKPALDTIAAATEHAARHGISCRTLLIDNGSTDDTIRAAGQLVSEVFSHKNATKSVGASPVPSITA